MTRVAWFYPFCSPNVSVVVSFSALALSHKTINTLRVGAGSPFNLILSAIAPARNTPNNKKYKNVHFMYKQIHTH